VFKLYTRRRVVKGGGGGLKKIFPQKKKNPLKKQKKKTKGINAFRKNKKEIFVKMYCCL